VCLTITVLDRDGSKSMTLRVVKIGSSSLNLTDIPVPWRRDDGFKSSSEFKFRTRCTYGQSSLSRRVNKNCRYFRLKRNRRSNTRLRESLGTDRVGRIDCISTVDRPNVTARRANDRTCGGGDDESRNEAKKIDF